MKPEELLDPQGLPDDLRWIEAHFKLSRQDPVYLLIAWHWKRVQKAEDTFRAAQASLEKAVDGRIELIAESAEAAAELAEVLVEVKDMLDKKPKILGEQIDGEIEKPVAKIRALENSLAAVVKSVEAAVSRVHRREILAGLLVGAAIGALSAWILCLA